MFRLFLCLIFPTAVLAYTTGAGTEACTDANMIPLHGPPSQPVETAPHTLTLDLGEQHPALGTNMTLTSTQSFQGFLIMAFNEDLTVPVGQFEARGTTLADGVQQTCSGNALTHTNLFQPTNEVQLVWSADTPPNSPITQFYVTLVVTRDLFWAKVKVANIPPGEPETISPTSEAPDVVTGEDQTPISITTESPSETSLPADATTVEPAESITVDGTTDDGPTDEGTIDVTTEESTTDEVITVEGIIVTTEVTTGDTSEPAEQTTEPSAPATESPVETPDPTTTDKGSDDNVLRGTDNKPDNGGNSVVATSCVLISMLLVVAQCLV